MLAASDVYKRQIHYPFFNYQLIKQYEKVIPFTGNSIRMFCLHQH